MSSDHNTTMDSISEALYRAVAERDYDSLATLFANDARDAVISFLSMDNRWQPSSKVFGGRGDSGRAGEKEEENNDGDEDEKMDAFLQQLAYHEEAAITASNAVVGVSRFLRPSSATRSTSTPAQDPSYYVLLREIAVFLAEQQKRQRQKDKNGTIDMDVTDDDTMDTSDNSSEGSKQCGRTYSSKRKKLELSADAARLLRGSSAILSDSRPPANFVVYEQQPEQASGGTPAPATTSTTTAGGRQANMNHDNNRAPIFDGSVANATPPPLGAGAGATAVAGGAGTILHLACALDVPLALAFLLVMGSDVRSCHTAFRRLMVHEAACNGSIKCLQLLLELGRKYSEDKKEAASGRQDRQETQVQSRSCASIPFLPRRSSPNNQPSRAQPPSEFSCSLPPDLYSNCRPSGLLFARKAAHSKPPQQGDSYDFVSLLRLFRDFAEQVNKDEISELDAARKFLECTSLAELSKACLARSCSFSSAYNNVNSDAGVNLVLQRPGHPGTTSSGASSDGHGNTPLHWASFKNETECVKLLLKFNADPNARAFPSGWTPLHDAAYSNSSESIELLLNAGADVDARANSGATPLCFAAQEDAAEAAALLMASGADLSTRCAGSTTEDGQPQVAQQAAQSRFSGYTPLHYCAHYNASRAARILLQYPMAAAAMEITDLSDRLAIHVAVARGSSDVLKELLRAGARVQTRQKKKKPRKIQDTRNNMNLVEGNNSSSNNSSEGSASRSRRGPANGLDLLAPSSAPAAASPSTPHRRRIVNNNGYPLAVSPDFTPGSRSRPRSSSSSTVSSPLLLQMIPAQPVQSSKPWNCLSQRSINECRQLISEAEQSWTMERHGIFTPADRLAVKELLLVGKRLETLGTGIYVYDMWPHVLSFCGRGWFDKGDTEPSESSLSTLEDVLKEVASGETNSDSSDTGNEVLNMPNL